MLQYLDHPIVYYLALSVLLWASVFAVRTWFPRLWVPLTRWPSMASPVSHIIQALPTTIAGAAIGALHEGGSITHAVAGAVSGAGAPVLHHLLKRIPGPYRGALLDAGYQAVRRTAAWEKAKQAGKGGPFLVGLLVLLCTGCGAAGVNQARELCYAKARLGFHERADECDTEACIEDEAGQLKRDQEACP